MHQAGSNGEKDGSEQGRSRERKTDASPDVLQCVTEELHIDIQATKADVEKLALSVQGFLTLRSVSPC